MENVLPALGVQHGFYARPAAHLPPLATGAGLGTIFRSSGIVRFVQGGVVKTFRCTTYRDPDSNMDDFDRAVLARLESLFEADEVQTLTFRADAGQPAQDAAVKVVHNATGAEVVCNDFPSQIKNKSIALIGLVELLRTQS